jgi:hypothetical protein
MCGSRGWVEGNSSSVSVFRSLENPWLTICDRYESGFQKAGAKITLWWEKVKAVKGRKGISRFLDEIERAKLALVLAHQNAAG